MPGSPTQNVLAWYEPLLHPGSSRFLRQLLRFKWYVLLCLRHQAPALEVRAPLIQFEHLDILQQ